MRMYGMKVRILPREVSRTCGRFFFGSAANNCREKSAEVIVPNTEVQLTQDSLLERILSPSNMNAAYKRVVSNKGSGGIDAMSTSDLLSWLLAHKENLIHSLYGGNYRPNPVRRVEIPKEGGERPDLWVFLY